MGNRFSSEPEISGPIGLHHFKLGRAIGKGAFGKVRIVEKRDTKSVLALKYINKHKIIAQRAQHGVLRERAILERIEHPFLVNMRFAFQDDQNLFLVLDLMLGGDLRFHMTRMGRLDPEHVLFYAAETACALQYLHQRNVVHRDVKPDNLLLDAEGHVHLTDFNCACVISGPSKGLLSEAGTHGYMAPEIYARTGYFHAVDWWSLGITLYELLYTFRPFESDRLDRLIAKVRYQDPQFPRFGHPTKDGNSRATTVVDEGLPIETIALIQGLLRKNPTKRLGPKGKKLWDQPAFRGHQRAKVEMKQVEPPFKPDPDISNFTNRFELEEVLLAEKSLTARPPRRAVSMKHLQSPYSREYLRLEREFETFDQELYDRYTGIINPNTLSVGEPPEWVRCVDHQQDSERPRQGLRKSSVPGRTPVNGLGFPPETVAPSGLASANDNTNPSRRTRSESVPADASDLYSPHHDLDT